MAEPAYSTVAEQQMRKWSLVLEVQQRSTHEEAVRRLPERIHPYVAVARESGAHGEEVARRIGEILGWQVLDRELLHEMAQRYKVPEDMLDFVDETTSNWLLEVFGKWMNQKVVTQSEYAIHLGQIVLLAARSHNCVFVGRGCRFLLPRERGVCVNFIGPHEWRVEQVMQQRNLSHHDAAERIKEIDHGRRSFAKEHFGADTNDPLQYDLVINMKHIEVEDAAQMVVEQTRRLIKNIPPAG